MHGDTQGRGPDPAAGGNGRGESEPAGGTGSRGAGFWTGAFRSTVVPLLLLIVTPPTTILLWMCVQRHGGSLTDLVAAGPAALVADFPLPSLRALAWFAGFAVLQVVLLLVLPGPRQTGPVTPAGNRPVYRANGVASFLVSHALVFGALVPSGVLDPAAFYRGFGELLSTLNVMALTLCAGLYVKGLRFPSSSDAGSSGNPVWDFYWGTELHPRIGPIELKQLVNSRIGMTGWSVVVWLFALAQAQIHGEASTSILLTAGLTSVYLFKFFIWEIGYFASIDVMHDRFGFYIAWGILCWVPGVYTLTGQWLVDHPADLSPVAAVAIAVLGLASIWANYDADAQRKRVRDTGGKTTVWGRAPEVMEARWRSSDGQPRTSLLLLSGWWGLARHVHYVPEILLALAWSLPAGLGGFLPYFYVTFLTILLVDRAGRDDRRCAAKYGAAWDEYRARVKWRILPGVY